MSGEAMSGEEAIRVVAAQRALDADRLRSCCEQWIDTARGSLRPRWSAQIGWWLGAQTDSAAEAASPQQAQRSPPG